MRDTNGRSIKFNYDPLEPHGRISKIIDPSRNQVLLSYDSAARLIELAWPDGTSKHYLYERTDLPWALTGVIDEKTVRLATYSYDAVGRAVDTQWAGGADHYAATYTSPPQLSYVDTHDDAYYRIFRDPVWQLAQGAQVVTPTGTAASWTSSLLLATPHLTGQSQPSGSGYGASNRYQSYDANGNIASTDDFTGNRSCLVSDLSRNRVTTRVEGLPNTVGCGAVTPAGVAIPALSRKTSIQYHPDWNVESKRAEPLKLTTMVYNGQPDPFAGGVAATCAPSTALPIDLKPIVVMCKQVEQATTDADGHLGFSAVLNAAVPPRQQTWTYNQYGQVLTAKGPRTDVNDTTTYVYYPDATADHTMGDLAQLTNPVGQVTNYTHYNKNGQVLRMVEPSGVVTVNTYDLRQRLTSSTVGGLQTSYTYDPVGQLIRLTLPDTTAIAYTYDDAHRLTRITDQAGNAVTYTLDNAGNRTQDQITDANGALSRTITRAFDALGRVAQVSGAAN